MEPKQKLTPEQAKLVHDNVDLAHHIALSEWRKNRQEMEKYEVVSLAYQGLVTAAMRFDPSRVTPETLASGKAFAGYARTRILGSIVDWQRSRDHVPRRERSSYKAFQEQGWGQGRSPEQIADITGMEVEKVRTIIQAVEHTSVSLDTPPEYWDEAPQYAVGVASPEDVEGSVLEAQVLRAVSRTIESLPQTHQVIVALRYYSGHELPDIAAHLGMRLPLVREMHTESMLAIHEALLKEAS